MFGRKKPSAPLRTIPDLDPDYFGKIHASIQAYGGSDSLELVAAGVGNAIYNTGQNYFERLNDRRAAHEFAELYQHRDPSDTGVTDQMIDHLIAYDGGTQEFLTTLLERLQDVLSRPA